MPEMSAVKNGGFPEPLGGHAVRLVDSRHERCGHSTRVRLPEELGARVVRRIVCEQCHVAYEATRVEDCGLDQEIAELNAALVPPAQPSAPTAQPYAAPAPIQPSAPIAQPYAAPAPVQPSAPAAIPAPAPQAPAPVVAETPAPVAAPEPVAPAPTVAAHAQPVEPTEPVSAPPPSAGLLPTVPVGATPTGSPAAPKRKTAIGPELKMPSFKRKPKAGAAAAAPAAGAPAPAAPAKKRATAIGPEIKLPSFKRKAKAPAAATPVAGAMPVAPSAPAKKRATAIGPELKMPSFRRKPKAGAPVAAPAPLATAAAPAAPTPVAPAPAAKKRATAIGPEIKLPSFKRNPKAAAAAPAAGAPAPAKKRATAIGPEIKMPSFKRKPKAPAAAAPVAAPAVAPMPQTPAASAVAPTRSYGAPPAAAPAAAMTAATAAAYSAPQSTPAPAKKRATAIGPEIKLPSFRRPAFATAGGPGRTGGGSAFAGTSWRRLSVPIAGGAVILGLLLLRGGSDDNSDLGSLPTTVPAAVSSKPADKGGKSKGDSGKASKDAQVVAGSNFTLALPNGWQRITPTGGATFAAQAPGDDADATLWIKRDPSLDFATFEANSLDQLKQLGGSAKVIDRKQGPTVEQTVVTLGTDAPKGAPNYEVVLRASGPYYYYLATTVQPGAASDVVSAVELLQDSLLPTGSGK